MKSRSLLLTILVIAVGILVWQVVPSWRQLTTDTPVGSSTTSTMMTPSSIEPAPVAFTGDRRKPYVLEWYGQVGDQPIAWQLTVDSAKVQGLAYTSTTVFDTYGSVVTSTDGLIVTAYQKNGEEYAMVSGTWVGNVFSGVLSRDQATGSVHLLPETVNQARISFDEAAGTWEDVRRGMSCDFSVRMPVIEAANGVSRAAADQINQTLRQLFLETGQTATQYRDAYLRQCRTELEEEARSLKADGDVGGMFRRSVNTGIIVSMNRAPYLSFNVSNYAYYGGAHGLSGNEGVVFDTRTGRRVSFRDLFRDQTIEPVARTHALIAQSLLDQYGDELFDENRQKLEAYVALYRRPSMTELVRTWETGDMGFVTTSNFLLVPGGIQVIFQQYEVAPYAVGLPTVFLPITAWANEASEAVRTYLSSR